jgi:3-phenylpropionate/trans-cinnamate dioxygenase ferredoxin subunit
MESILHWVVACDASTLDVDDVVKVETSSGALAVYRLDDGYFATQDTCTHAVASLADGFVEDGMIECPLHAARFCIRSGKAKSMPATVALATHPVRVEGGKVWVGLAATAELAP